MRGDSFGPHFLESEKGSLHLGDWWDFAWISLRCGGICMMKIVELRLEGGLLGDGGLEAVISKVSNVLLLKLLVGNSVK